MGGYVEYVVFLAGLALFVAYPRFWVLPASVVAFMVTGALMPRVWFIDALGNQWWITGVYGIAASVLLYAGFAGVFSRLNERRNQRRGA
jgi:hypothetical protein